ncbi:sporulene cyclase [Bacillus oleivorans]|uniref:Sporulene cyclase n=1 Tax=Bacillus oleivorans TaxID=1448271 RepID=A0A285CSU5_9BACI|nr:squalene--hopene cyclase [Bacillus oleivorans]SNX70495.1 sporulene cyclase [Bacillus oleivorans]
MIEQVQAEIERLVAILKEDQQEDGAWTYPFEMGILTDAYMIILLRTLEWHDEPLIKKLVKRIESRQEQNGAWKLYEDETEGNLSLTIDAYYALLYSGYRQKTDPHMKRASHFIRQKGGLKKAKVYTKVLLAMTGQYPWPSFFPFPAEFILLPRSFPFNFYDISVFARANLAPMMILTSLRFQIRTNRSPDLSNLHISERNDYWEEYRSKEWRTFFSMIQHGISTLLGIPERIRARALDEARRYMLQRIEPDGTLLSYFSSTFYMIFAMLALGASKQDPIIVKAVEGLASMGTVISEQVHIQYTTAAVWNTSLIGMALQKAGLPDYDPAIIKANQYLLTKQHQKYGDWVVHNPKGEPGGWGFSESNTINPDVDDTTASLRSLTNAALDDPNHLQAWKRGIGWLHTMQNRDGGWPAFERGINNRMLELLPVEGAEFFLMDPSSVDLTGRTLEFLGNYTQFKNPNNRVEKAVKWIYGQQEKNGSWYGRWGICYLYGTWAAITGLIAVGESPNHPAIQKAIRWLKQTQNTDGGWGESCKSDIYKKFIPLNDSTLTQTAWAVDALIAGSDRPSRQIDNGIAFLIRNSGNYSWTERYPTGQGMADFFYIHYHSYRYIWPLVALSNYKRKYFQA